MHPTSMETPNHSGVSWQTIHFQPMDKPVVVEKCLVRQDTPLWLEETFSTNHGFIQGFALGKPLSRCSHLKGGTILRGPSNSPLILLVMPISGSYIQRWRSNTIIHHPLLGFHIQRWRSNTIMHHTGGNIGASCGKKHSSNFHFRCTTQS